nr:hypothetical protein [Tanacetum cinerariifolium]
MSDASSSVTYTSVGAGPLRVPQHRIKYSGYSGSGCRDGVTINTRRRHHNPCDVVTKCLTASNAQRYYREDSTETGPPRVIVYGYDGLPIQPVAPTSLYYVPEPEHPPSPDYMPGPEHPPSPIEIPYVLEPDYPKYDGLPMQPVAPPSPDYVLGPKHPPYPDYVPDDHADYPANGGDGNDKPFDDDDDDDTDDEDEEPFEDEEGDEEEEDHLALADSSAVPIVDPVLPAGDT